jgi:hypothetical protein
MIKSVESAKEIKGFRQTSEDYLRTKRLTWDRAEQLAFNQLNDSISTETKSQVFDPKLSTLAIERSYRVMAQLQSGKVRGMSKNDMGDALLKNLILEKYVIPNSTAQFDFLTKMRMMDLYSNIYGNMFSLIDWDIKPSGYVGPDIWLLNIRDVFPQVGAVSLDDSDKVVIRSWRPISFFEQRAKEKDYINMDALITKLKTLPGSKQSRNPSTAKTQREFQQYPTTEPAKGAGYYEVLSMYERDEWTDYCTDADMTFRERDNPQDDGDLPVKCKYAIPLLDDIMGMSDFERGASMQMAINSAWNLYLDAVKMSIFPPILINKDNIASMSSITQTAAAKWLVRNQISNAAMPLNLSPQGINTFNNVYQVATASIMNLFGTTETQTTVATDPGFGKTPEAIKAQAQRENTRDNADRFYMEQYITSVMKKFCNLIAKKQTAAITLRLFQDEIDDLAKSYPDIKDMYNASTGKLAIKKTSGDMLYDYEIIPGSTYMVDQQQQQQNMGNLLTLFQQAQTPNGNMLVEQLKQDGYQFNFGELLKRIISNSGIQDWDKILTEIGPQEQAKQILAQHAAQFQSAISAMNANPNQTPPMPNGTQPGGMAAPGGQPPPSQPPEQNPMGQSPIGNNGFVQ